MKLAIARFLAVLGLLVSLASCVVYDPYYPYGAPPAGPSAFDRAWGAAEGAMRDQGIGIAQADRASGVIAGRRGGININTRVLTQADGKVRVEFNVSGAVSEDSSLPDRLSRAYDARMGR
jgi:hypothetical protein